MTSQYRHRRTSNPSITFNALEPGEIAVNSANRQLAVGDANPATIGQPLALIALRFFDPRAIYALNDLVFNAGVIYRAKGSAGPGAFNSAQWDVIAGTADPRYVQKTGDVMTGALHINNDGYLSLGGTSGDMGVFSLSGDAQGSQYRWSVQLGADTSFSTFNICAFDNAGTNGQNVFSIDRATGEAVFLRPVAAPDPATADDLATKRYVDTKVSQSGAGAAGVTFEPTGDVAATNVQDAITELDDEKVRIAGDTMSGPLYVEPKGSQLGGASGNAANGALQVADANIKFYDNGPGNWGGIGCDASGNVWIRTAYSGSPAAVAWADYTGFLHITKDPELDDHVANKRYVDGGSTGFVKTTARQTLTGGFRIAPHNLGNGSGTVRPEPYDGNYQFITNNAAFVIGAPVNDCAIDLLITNVAGAGVVSFSGFLVGASTGDPMTSLVGARFIVSIRRINAFATYTVKQVS